MRERLINRRQQGDLGEASAIEWLTRQGASVLIPFGHSRDYDLVADVGGRLIRIQVKTSTYQLQTPDGHKRWTVAIRTNGGNQSWTGVTKLFEPAKVDYLFVVAGDGRRWFLPASSVESSHSVNLGGQKYSEFEVDATSPILDLVYGAAEPRSRLSRDTRGSFGDGEPSGSVKAVPMAEWVRIPPPPLPANGAPAPRERELGRAGQAIVRGKRQMTIPAKPYAEAALEIGDRVRFRADGPGRVIMERIEGPASVFGAPAPSIES